MARRAAEVPAFKTMRWETVRQGWFQNLPWPRKRLEWSVKNDGLDWAGLAREREEKKNSSELKKHKRGPVPGLA